MTIHIPTCLPQVTVQISIDKQLKVSPLLITQNLKKNTFVHKKNIKICSFKSSKNIQKKEGGPDRSVSDNQSSSVTLNELAMKARKDTVISSFSKEVIH